MSAEVCKSFGIEILTRDNWIHRWLLMTFITLLPICRGAELVRTAVDQ